MKRKENDDWANFVSIENNESYIIKLLKKFEIDTYNFCYEQCGLALMFAYKRDTYKAYIDDIAQGLVLMKRNLCGNKKDKEFYHRVDIYTGIDCWYEMFRDLKDK